VAVEDTGGPGVAAGGGGAGGTRVVVVVSGADGAPGEDSVAAERIGVLGGTFDPVHIGHLVAAVNARHALDLDRVILMVANVPWQKAGQRVLTSAEDRLALVAAAVGDVPGLEAGRLEIDRGGESYTAETLVELASLHPAAELFLIVGWDVAAELTTWDRWEDIQSLATLVVVNRPGAGRPAGLDSDGWRVEEVIVPNLEISSTDLRARSAAGQPLDYLVPEAAVRCLRARGLYATNR
jgi:nicotinate-nucleotide adenylyltransferase